MTDPGSAKFMLDMIVAEMSAPIYWMEDVFLDAPEWRYGIEQNESMQ